MRELALLGLAMVLALGTAHAAEEVDLELVLLADATGSIDEDEIRFQRQGYADAITHPEVVATIRQGMVGRIAVTYVEWGSAESQGIVAPWTVIDGPDTAAAFAKALLGPPRMAFGRNAIGSALMAAKALIDGNDFAGTRRTIDLSGDSANSWGGVPVPEARALILAEGITINGLAVLCRMCNGRPVGYDLEAAFAQRIIGGPASFVVTADGTTSFTEAVRRKLVLEIAELAPRPASGRLGRLLEQGRLLVDLAE